MKKTNFRLLLDRFGMSVTLIILGLLLLLVPDSAPVVIAYVIGGVLILAGIVFAVGALLDRQFSKGFWALACLSIGGTLLGNPLILARNISRFLGILVAIEGGDCLRRGSRTFGILLLAAAVALVLAPMALSRLVFSLCGLVVLAIGIFMLLSRIRETRFLDKGKDDIIDAL